jgi:hypothetical protein
MEIVSLGSPGLLLLGAKRLARITEQLVLQHLGHLLFGQRDRMQQITSDQLQSKQNRKKLKEVILLRT